MRRKDEVGAGAASVKLIFGPTGDVLCRVLSFNGRPRFTHLALDKWGPAIALFLSTSVCGLGLQQSIGTCYNLRSGLVNSAQEVSELGESNEFD